MFDLNHLPHAPRDEKRVFFLRRHPITLISMAIGGILLVLFPFIVWLLMQIVFPDIWASEIGKTLVILGGSAFFLYAWLFLFQSFIDYYLDIWVVTNHRILSIEQSGLFSRTVSELRLYRVQDVTSSVKGVIPTLFNYGDVEIETASNEDHFVFEQISNPTHVAKTIMEYVELDRKNNMDEIVEDLSGKESARADAPTSTKKTGMV